MEIHEGDIILIMNLRGEAMEFRVGMSRKPFAFTGDEYAALHIYPQTESGVVQNVQQLNLRHLGVDFPED